MKAPSLKIQKTLEELPKNGYNIAKAMRIAGYSESTTRSGEQYERLRRHTQDLFHPDRVKKELNREIKRMKKEKDNTNFCRLFEIKTKISIPELRKQEISTDSPREINIIYGQQTQAQGETEVKESKSK